MAHVAAKTCFPWHNSSDSLVVVVVVAVVEVHQIQPETAVVVEHQSLRPVVEEHQNQAVAAVGHRNLVLPPGAVPVVAPQPKIAGWVGVESWTLLQNVSVNNNNNSTARIPPTVCGRVLLYYAERSEDLLIYIIL